MDASGITFKGQMFGNVKLADPSAIVGKGEEETKGQSFVFTKSGARDFYKLVGISQQLPFVHSIFFFSLLSSWIFCI
jgi:hypothetical protein